MGSDDFATARHYPEMDGSDMADGVPSANVFTPISAVDRLREKPRRRRGHTHTRPMMIPGQRYGYEAYEEEPVPYTESFLEKQGGAPVAADYQQAYWAHLQEVAGEPPVQAESVNREAPHIPAYLRKQGMNSQDESVGSFSQRMAEIPQNYESVGFPEDLSPGGNVLEEVFGESTHIYTEQAPFMATNPYDPWPLTDAYPFEAAADENNMGAPEYADIYGNDAVWHEPKLLAHPAPGEDAGRHETVPPPAPLAASFVLRAKEKVAKAFTHENRGNQPRLSLGKVVAICAITTMLVFCAVEMGKIVLDLLQNEEEMKTVREEYYARAGVELLRDASRVDLPPPGVTFTPTATPRPSAEPSQASIASADTEGTAAQEEAAEAMAAQNKRTKATSYEDNPMGNIREALIPPRESNADIIGRLTIDGVMDETVVKRNNTYYLTHNARGSFSASGAVFMDEACGIRIPPENALLRGQSTAANHPFQSLLSYRDGGAEYVRRHAFIQFDTLYEEAQYVVFAVIIASSDPNSPQYFNYAGYPSFQSDRQMESYVTAAKQQSLYEIQVDVQPSDRLLTLSTIGDGATRESLVIMARKLRPGETLQSFSSALNAVRTY